MSDTQVSSHTMATQAEPIVVDQEAPLVATKTQVPLRQHNLLARKRLVDHLHAHLNRSLIVISAPAGYGKTSLLTDFAHDSELPVCWYGLDTYDRDLRVFLEYLVSAISRRFSSFGGRTRALLQQVSDPASSLYPIVDALLRDIDEAIPEYFVLIMDDHHTVEDQEEINDFLDLFVSSVEENCHLILASRRLPILPSFSFLVAQRQAAGLGIDELRFTAEEVQSLARRNFGLKLGLEQAESLTKQTGGWITGLLLTVRPSWEKSQIDVPDGKPVSVDLYDYLSTQVLEQQPAALRDFLLTSSVLDELSPDLCSSVLGVDRAAELVGQVRTRNLFTIEYDGAEGRIRYHDLFREFLRSRLRQQDLDRFQVLTRRAADAYGRRGEWQRAVSRYLTLEDYDRVGVIIEDSAEQLFDTGRWNTLAGWIDSLPQEEQEARPGILVHRGKIYADQGAHERALMLYERAENLFFVEGENSLVARVLAEKGVLMRFQGRYAEAVAECQRALTLVNGANDREKSAMALAYRNAGLCELRQGGLAEGMGTLERALRVYQDLEAPYDVGLVQHDLGLGEEMAGDLAEAQRHYHQALRRWEKLGSAGPWANTLNSLGVIHYLRGEYTEAQAALSEALVKSQQAGDLRVKAFVWGSLGDLHRDLGDLEKAQEAYTQALEVAHRARVGFIVTYVLDALGNTFRLQEEEAHAWNQLRRAMEHAEQHGSSYEIGLCHTSLGILASEVDDPESAQYHLDQAIRLLESGGSPADLARAHLYRAQVAFLAGGEESALVDVERTLVLTSQLDYDQFLVVEGSRIQPLLQFAAKRGCETEVLKAILERIKAYEKLVARQVKAARPVVPTPSLKILALGTPRVEVDDQAVHWTFAKSRDLFFYLLEHPEGLRKEEIGAEFWPTHDTARLDSIFRSTIYRLRRTLFRECVVYEEGLYRFNWESEYWYDVEMMERLIAETIRRDVPQADITLLEEATELYQGDYLVGLDAIWAEPTRRRLRETHAFCLQQLAEKYVEIAELDKAVETYKKLLMHEPCREAAHRELMRCYHRLDNRDYAIRQYHICAETLREELGVDPNPETDSLYLEILG